MKQLIGKLVGKLGIQTPNEIALEKQNEVLRAKQDNFYMVAKDTNLGKSVRDEVIERIVLEFEPVLRREIFDQLLFTFNRAVGDTNPPKLTIADGPVGFGVQTVQFDLPALSTRFQVYNGRY